MSTTVIPTATITIVPTNITTTVTYCAKTYRQCGGTGWNGTCSSCGAYVGTSGVCPALIELTVPEKKHAECPCCECE